MYRQDNGYIVSRQGKPPDFVLEVASESTGAMDTGVKRDNYEYLGVAEYWRFDETGGCWHGAPLAGDRLADGAIQAHPHRKGGNGGRRCLSRIQPGTKPDPALGKCHAAVD